MTKKQTKTPPAKRTAKQTKGEAKRTARPTANPATPTPAADGKGAWVLFPEWKADARGIVPPPPIPPPPEPGAKVDPWRDKAREIVAECGWSWEALEENERQPGSRAIVGMGGAVYWALAHAVRLTPAQLDEAAGNLKRVLVAAKKDAARFCEACALFPEAVRRLAESPATPTANADGKANPATPPEPATPTAKTKRKRWEWGPEALSMAREFEKALPGLLPKNQNPLNAKGQLDARRLRGCGGWKTIRECFDRWTAGAGMFHPGLRRFPRGPDAEEAALRSLFRALKDSKR